MPIQATKMLPIQASKMLPILFLLSVLLSTSHASNVEFCVANYSASEPHASGYACKSPASVTADDFVFSGLTKPGNTSNSFHSAVTPAFVDQYAGLNGLALSGARYDLDVGGVIPLHNHRGGSELVFVLQGKLTVGFISTENTFYVNTVREGEITIFPQGLFQFLVNSGKGKAVAFSSFSSQNPGTQIVHDGSDLASALFEKVSNFLDSDQIEKLKGVFGGSGYAFAS